LTETDSSFTADVSWFSVETWISFFSPSTLTSPNNFNGGPYYKSYLPNRFFGLYCALKGVDGFLIVVASEGGTSGFLSAGFYASFGLLTAGLLTP